MQLEIWGDGASCGNGNGPGGWCALVKIDGEIHHNAYGGDMQTTNNVMEMQAIIGGIESVIAMFGITGNTDKHNIKIISDSNYIIGAFNEGWLIKWMMAGWRKSPRSNVLRTNAEVWQRLVGLVSELETMGNTVSWMHVNGHVGIIENEYCDKIAKAEKQKRKVLLLNENNRTN